MLARLSREVGEVKGHVDDCRKEREIEGKEGRKSMISVVLISVQGWRVGSG